MTNQEEAIEILKKWTGRDIQFTDRVLFKPLLSAIIEVLDKRDEGVTRLLNEIEDLKCELEVNKVDSEVYCRSCGSCGNVGCCAPEKCKYPPEPGDYLDQIEIYKEQLQRLDEFKNQSAVLLGTDPLIDCRHHIDFLKNSVHMASLGRAFLPVLVDIRNKTIVWKKEQETFLLQHINELTNKVLKDNGF